MIEVRNLVKRYGTHTAVDHLSFTVKRGQIYGFLGPNGAGKSTTMNIMTGYLGATEGEVVINGHDILKEPELAKRSIGYLPEMPPLYLDMKVEEYLQFVAALKKLKRHQIGEQVEKVIELTKIQDVRGRLIKNLSKGYKQRVGLAQAIIGFPEIIILDEPTVGLDPKQIIEIRELIRELSKSHTIILSSHILAEISEVCDYIMIISKGKLVASDTPENLEKQLKGTEQIFLQARASEETVKEILSAVEHIVHMSVEVLEDGITRMTVTPEEGFDIREDLFFAFAGAECPLLELQKTKATLEKVFLELTQNEKQDADTECLEESEEEETDEGNL
ncbi:MAG: ATP-binding cassette domain-containing protein [Lachnospiraceae bacterium]|nr:ATP-binding cassette domain-containing protein [Lachnospiraceae bacterium]